jgi:hypothetical protein
VLSMSAKRFELYAALGDALDSVLVAKVWMERAGDLYITTNAPKVMSGRYSYHASGVTHRYTDLINKRTGEGEAKRGTLDDLKGYVRLKSWTCPVRIPANGYHVRVDTDRRRTLIARVPDFGWTFSVWAIEPGRRDLAERINDTNPWPTVRNFASLLMDWSDPWILMAFASMGTEPPYKVVRYEPALPGRVPIEIYPEAYEGTWLGDSSPRWQPGQPFPESWLRQSRDYVARQQRVARIRQARRS